MSIGSLLRRLGGVFRPSPRIALKPGDVDFLVFGIGNPGPQYEQTRHNVGFMAADLFSQRLHSAEPVHIHHAVVSRVALTNGRHIAVAKPQTFVNRSGDAFRVLCGDLGLSLSSCLVMVDDFHLPLGSLRLRKAGSDGGHNGLKSIIAQSGQEFPRLRIGIGPVPPGVSIIDFVLGEFSPREMEQLQQVLSRVHDAIVSFCTDGIERTMSRFNS